MKLYEKIFISLAFFLGILEIILVQVDLVPAIYSSDLAIDAQGIVGIIFATLLWSSPAINLLCLAFILLKKKGVLNMAGLLSIPLAFIIISLRMMEDSDYKTWNVLFWSLANIPIALPTAAILILRSIRPNQKKLA